MMLGVLELGQYDTVVYKSDEGVSARALGEGGRETQCAGRANSRAQGAALACRRAAAASAGCAGRRPLPAARASAQALPPSARPPARPPARPADPHPLPRFPTRALPTALPPRVAAPARAPPSPCLPQALGLNIKESHAYGSNTVHTRVHGFKPVLGGGAGPPEQAGIIKEGDVFVGVSAWAIISASRRAAARGASRPEEPRPLR